MKVTAKLVAVYRVDAQLRGLESRLRGAETFLASQTKQLTGIETKRAAVQGQLRQLNAAIAEHEGEIKSLDERISKLRAQMNQAQTDREYKAFLAEVNNFKSQRSQLEDEELDLMTRLEDLRAKLEKYEAEHAERRKMQQVAMADRDERAEQIRDRVAELRAERERLAKEVPPSAIALYERQTALKGEEAMASVQEEDRRRHEYTCGACMMNIPIERISALLASDDIIQCSSCGAILFLDEELAEQMQAALSKK